MLIIENINFQNKLHRQKGPDAPPRAALSGGACTARTSGSGHLRWSPNFRLRCTTIPGTFFITRAKSKYGRKWPETTSIGGGGRNPWCRRFSLLRQPNWVKPIGLASWWDDLPSPVGYSDQFGRNRCRQSQDMGQSVAIFGQTFGCDSSLHRLNWSRSLL